MAESLFFYKLVSPYTDEQGRPIDQTLNCKLSINQIDSNFLTLKDYDIKSAEFAREDKKLVLTRNNGEKLIVLLDDVTYNLNVDAESGDSGTTLTIEYDGKDGVNEVVIPNIVTVDKLMDLIDNEIINKVLTRVITDNTLIGNGTIKSPLGISELEKGTPAIKLIDRLNGEELPLNPTKGDKYVTKEKINDFGRLYNYKAIESIKEKLELDGGVWRVPTKADWDCLLSSIEPCNYVDEHHYAHEDTRCHKMLGKYAGRRLKSKCGWEGQEECECKNTVPFSDNFCDSGSTGDTSTTEESTSVVENNAPYSACVGTDDFGMRILPSGYKDEYDTEVKQIGKSSAFWTDSYVCDSSVQDIYVKKFDFDKCGVTQEAQCPSDFYSLRLVKDYDGENYYESEIIDGLTYRTILFPECGQVWMESNFYSEYEDSLVVEDGKTDRIVFYVVVWDGTKWQKRILKEGESIVIMDGNEFCQHNIDYRVFIESDENKCNNQVLVNSDDAVTERVLNVVLPLIEEEKEERIAADEALAEAIDEEINRAISAETALDKKIDAETERAISAETALDEKIDAEIERAISAETALDEKIDAETERAISAETALDEKIDQEIADRIADVDEEEARAKAREDEIECQLIDNSEDFILNMNGGVILKSKCDTNDVTIKINADFGTF